MRFFLLSVSAMSHVSTRNASSSISENVFPKKQCSVEIIGQAAFESIVEIEKEDNNVTNWPNFSEAGSEALLKDLLIADNQVPEICLNKSEPFVYNTFKEDCLTRSRKNISNAEVSCQNHYAKNESASKNAKRTEATESKRNLVHNEKSPCPSDEVHPFPVNNISSSSVPFTNVGEATSTDVFQFQNIVIKKEILSEYPPNETKDQRNENFATGISSISADPFNCLNIKKEPLSPSTFVRNEAESMIAKDRVQEIPMNKDETIAFIPKEKNCENISSFAINSKDLHIKSEDISTPPDRTKQTEATESKKNVHNEKSSHPGAQVKEFPVNIISSSSVSFTNGGEATSTDVFQYQNIVIKKEIVTEYPSPETKDQADESFATGSSISTDASNCLSSYIKKEPLSPRTFVVAEAEPAITKHQAQENNNISSSVSFKAIGGATSTGAFQYQNITIKKELVSENPFIETKNQTNENFATGISSISADACNCINIKKEPLSPSTFVRDETESMIAKDHVQEIPINKDENCLNSSKDINNEDTTATGLDITKQTEVVGTERNIGHVVQSLNPRDQVKEFPVNNISSSSVSFKAVRGDTSTDAFQYQNITIKKELVGENPSIETENQRNENFTTGSSISVDASNCLNSHIKKEPLSPSTFVGAVTESVISKYQVQKVTGTDRNTHPNNKSSNPIDQVLIPASKFSVNSVVTPLISVSKTGEATSPDIQYQNIALKKKFINKNSDTKSNDQVNESSASDISSSLQHKIYVNENISANTPNCVNVFMKQRHFFEKDEARHIITNDKIQDSHVNKSVVCGSGRMDCLNNLGENISPVATSCQDLYVERGETSKEAKIGKNILCKETEINVLHSVKSLNANGQLKQFPVNHIFSSPVSCDVVGESILTDALNSQSKSLKQKLLNEDLSIESKEKVAKEILQKEVSSAIVNFKKVKEDKVVVNVLQERESEKRISNTSIKRNHMTSEQKNVLNEFSSQPPYQNSKPSEANYHSDKKLANEKKVSESYHTESDQQQLRINPYTYVNNEMSNSVSNNNCEGGFHMYNASCDVEQARKGTKLNKTNDCSSVDCINKFWFKDTPEQNCYRMKEGQVSSDAELENASIANVVADNFRQGENISKVTENSEKPNEEHDKQCERNEESCQPKMENKSNPTLLCDNDQIKMTETPSNYVKASEFCYSNKLSEVPNDTTNVKSSCFIDDRLIYDFSSVEKNTFLGYPFNVVEVLKAMNFLEKKDHLAMKNLILQDRVIEVEKNLSENKQIVHRRVNFNFKEKVKRDNKHNLPSAKLPTAYADSFITTSNEYGSSLQPTIKYLCDNVKQQEINKKCLVADDLCNKKADKLRDSTGGAIKEPSFKRICCNTEKRNLVKENEYKNIHGNFSTFPNIDVKDVTNSDKDPVDKIHEIGPNENIYGIIQSRESLEKNKSFLSNCEVSTEELQNNEKKITVEGIDKDFLRKILKSVHSLTSVPTTTISSDHDKEIFSTPEVMYNETTLEASDSNSIQKLNTANILSQNQVNQQTVQNITPVSIVPVLSYQSEGSSFTPISKACNADSVSKVDSNSNQQSSLVTNMFRSQVELNVKCHAKRKAEYEILQEWKKSKVEALHNQSFDVPSLAACNTFKHKAHTEPVKFNSTTSTVHSKNLCHNVASYIVVPDSNINSLSSFPTSSKVCNNVTQSELKINENQASDIDFLSIAKWPLTDAKRFCDLVINSDFSNSDNPILAGSFAIDISEIQDKQIGAVETNELSVESIIINEKQRYNITSGNILLSYSVPPSSRSWDLICFIITWKVDFFLEYDKSKKPPPIANKCCRVSNVYSSYKCYYETYLPLLLLETWENMYSAWRSLNTKKRRYVWKVCAVEIKHREKVISITCDTVTSISLSEINPKECGVTLLEFISSHKRILGYVHGTWSREYMPEYDKHHPCFQHLKYSDDKCFKRKVLIYIALDNSRWIKKGDLLYVSMLTSIVNVLMKNEALVDMRRSLLCNTVLNPDICDVIKFELPDRHTDPRDHIHDLIKNLNLSMFSLTLVKTSPVCDSIRAIVAMVGYIKAHNSKVLIVARSESALTDIAYNLKEGFDRHLVILTKEIKNENLKPYVLHSHIQRSNHEKINSDILLTTVSTCHMCDMKKKLKHVNIKYCIMYEASMCTELECILPFLYNVPKIILMGNPSEYQGKIKGIPGIAADLGYYRSLFHRAW